MFTDSFLVVVLDVVSILFYTVLLSLSPSPSLSAVSEVSSRLPFFSPATAEC